MRRTRLLVLLAALALGACVYDLDFHTHAGVGGSAGSGSTGGARVCVPGATASCYDGPAGTEGAGICKAGAKTCAPDGMGWGACAGEVLPRPVDCASGMDLHCDGQVPACTGTLLWAKLFGDASAQEGLSVAVDSGDNVFVTGFFSGTVDFGGVDGQHQGSGGEDIFVVKLDPGGDHVWSKGFGDASDQRGVSIAVDSNGSVFVTGYFSGTVDFGGGKLTSAGGNDVFVAKLDAAHGDHLWSRSFGDASDAGGASVAVDAAGNAVVTGFFSGTVNFGAGSLMSAGGDDIFVAKLDANDGHCLWSKRFGDASDQRGRSVAVDGAGNVWVTGYFDSSTDFGGGPLVSAGGDDAFIVKLDAAGTHQWSKRFGDAEEQDGRGIAVDPMGRVALTGYFLGSMDFAGNDPPLTSAGLGDIFVAERDPDGSPRWSKRFGDPSDQDGAGIAVDSNGNVVLTGYIDGSDTDFGGGPLPSAGSGDIFVTKLGANGDHQWSKRFGDANNQVGFGIATDSTGNVVVTGFVNGSTDFGAGSLMSAGGTDVFVAKFAP